MYTMMCMRERKDAKEVQKRSRDEKRKNAILSQSQLGRTVERLDDAQSSIHQSSVICMLNLLPLLISTGSPPSLMDLSEI
jgi:hypothetical protein